MKKFNFKGIMVVLAVFVAAFSISITSFADANDWTNNPAYKQITDDGGRSIYVPKNVNKVYTTSPIGQNMIYTINPEKLLAWNFALTPIEKQYVKVKYQRIPVIKGMQMGGSFNYEAVIKAKPDLIFSVGTVDATTIASANEIQNKTNITVVLLDGSMKNMGKTYKKMGSITGDSKRAITLAKAYDKAYADVAKKAAKVPSSAYKTVYYAETDTGLKSDPVGSTHTEVIDFIKAQNVYKTGPTTGGGQSEINMEQLLIWNPDVIIVCPSSGADNPIYKNMFTNNSWKNLKAVVNKQVVMVPYGPFNWIDRPPSITRVLGAKWMGSELYPKYFNYNMIKETKDYYSLFYDIKLSTKQVKLLMKNSTLPGSKFNKLK